MYKLYIDYGQGYVKEKESTFNTIVDKLMNTNYDRYIIIKRENNTDILIDFNENREVNKQWQKVKKQKRT